MCTFQFTCSISSIETQTQCPEMSDGEIIRKLEIGMGIQWKLKQKDSDTNVGRDALNGK